MPHSAPTVRTPAVHIPIVRIPIVRTVVALGAVIAVPLTVVACEAKSTGDGAVAVTSTDDACDLSTTDLTTGRTDFEITNNGGKVTEFYVYGQNNRVLAEVENIAPGMKGKLSAEFTDPGTYSVACKPGMVGTGIRSDVSVTGEATQKSQAPADVEAAKARYLEYVRGQLNGLVSQVATFTGAVKGGDLDAARASFGLTRTFYERIEPVAESFPDLDPKIDMRWDDTEGGTQEFTGFHRIERFLFPPKPDEVGDEPGQVSPDDAARAATDDTKGAIDTVADRLLADVTELRDEVAKKDFEFETQMFVAGPQALIDEIAKTKVKGEEDRYSHTDLYDFAANIDGSETLIGELAPMIAARDQKLMDTITAQFTAIRGAIESLRQGDGYVSYATVDAATRRELSDRVDALSATLSRVPGLVMQK
ncbi:iron uptake system protein EfeO [Gordonia shandongensis]|uniref:iron uptake system protein EfeO n=1 Tax=Gordonia shandongensis TaxID=376351 RepID=UPI0003F5814A|nr:iron uptake system protein EfeO [Gordonia shandongensis]